ncbi:MAG TPA: dihydroorotate dehydrogenase (quinone) [Actinomycetota bacterium]|nr:dihydroorotate dehydrogenase (quinone) [Actinomycetota bacterium]
MGWYRAVARPLFFALPSESAHGVAGWLLGLPLPWERIGGAAGDPVLLTRVAGLELANPIGLAAGFDKTGRRLDPLGRLGFGYVVGGSFTLRPRAGHPKPRIVRKAGGALVNAMGLPNPGAAAVAEILRRTERTAPRLASLADEEPADVLAMHDLLQPLVDGFELNASSPNATWEHDASRVGEILDGLLARTSKPVFVKLPPFETDEERRGVLAMAAVAAEHGASGLTCSNARTVSEARLARGRGGLSGRPLLARTPVIVREVLGATGGELPINACGGISTPDDVLACLDAGATTVQLYTGLVYRGPRIVGELTRGLAAVLRERRIRAA